MQTVPFFIDAFLQPVRDNPQAQVAICAVMLLIVLDVLMGLVNAVMHKEYSSEKMRQGIAHKAVEMCFILLGIIIDATIIAGVDIGFTAPVLVGVCVYIIIMEIGSVMENAVKIWPHLADTPVFKFLSSVHAINAEEVGLSD